VKKNYVLDIDTVYSGSKSPKVENLTAPNDVITNYWDLVCETHAEFKSFGLRPFIFRKNFNASKLQIRIAANVNKAQLQNYIDNTVLFKPIIERNNPLIDLFIKDAFIHAKYNTLLIMLVHHSEKKADVMIFLDKDLRDLYLQYLCGGLFNFPSTDGVNVIKDGLTVKDSWEGWE
jgi:hypothetical protein